MQKFRKLQLIALMSVVSVGAAVAQTTGTPFDPSGGVTTFKNEFGAKLNEIFPLAIGIMLVPAGYRIVTRLVRRGMKV
jgi:hypothetical protein